MQRFVTFMPPTNISLHTPQTFNPEAIFFYLISGKRKGNGHERGLQDTQVQGKEYGSCHGDNKEEFGIVYVEM